MYKVVTITIREYVTNLYRTIDCQPVGQRLPIQARALEKAVGIIQTILNGHNIGQITLDKIDSSDFEYESIDGGHRKRHIWEFWNDKIKVNGQRFKDLSKKEQDDFLDTVLSFVIYDNLTVATKGLIFRNLNETSEVNHMEMLNSFGDIPIANLIRELTRTIPQIDNIHHHVFDYHISPKTHDKLIYEYVAFDNDRLKQDAMVARIVFRYTQEELLGGSSDAQLENMYNNSFSEAEIAVLEKKVNTHLDFLRKCALHRKQIYAKGLSQQEFKTLSLIWLHLQDTYKAFKIKDHNEFYKKFKDAFEKLLGPEYEVPKPSFSWDKEARFINEAFKNYLGAPHHHEKSKQVVRWLLEEFDIEKVITIQDPQRSATRSQKEAKLAQQDFKCAIDGKALVWKDAVAAHMFAHTHGGLTVMDNLAMVRSTYNTDMGGVSVEEYKEIKGL